MSFLQLAKAKKKPKPQYVEKKKTPSGEVRIYDESHIKKRWKEKVEKLKKLESNITNLRKKYKADLTDDNDPKTRALAAIVGLIDNTAMRVGNEASVDEHGSFGATTLRKEHAFVSGNKIRFKFKGKKGVQQDVLLDDAAVSSEIKKLLDGKKGKDLIFEYGDNLLFKNQSWFIGKIDESVLDVFAKNIEGTYDFLSFSKSNKQLKNTVCNIYESKWFKSENMLIFNVCGNRFLHHMVRYLVGTMVAGAQGKISLDYFEDLLNSPQKNVKIFKALPEGLILVRIDYDK